jgi:retinol dehydrogenase-12
VSDMDGKICVVTGANSGLGLVMSETFARRGATVVMVARDRGKGEDALALVKKSGEASLELADLSLLADVRALAARLSERFERIDVLMNNAGLYLSSRVATKEGNELTFTVNHLAPFLLTNLLADRLAEGARVITTSSGAHGMAKLDLDDLMMAKRWSGFRQYGNGKLANILFTGELARRFDRLTPACFHPGAVATGFAQDEPTVMGSLIGAFGSLVLRTPAKGADTGIWLAAEPEIARGEYYMDRKVKKPRRAALNAELAGALWAKSAELTGIT